VIPYAIDRKSNWSAESVAEMYRGQTSKLFASNEAIALLRQLKNDDLDFWFKPGAAGMESLPKSAYPEVKEAALQLMFQAIGAALAGPRRDEHAWVGAPVMKLADHIFRELVNLHNRRAHARRQKEGSVELTEGE
jgi:hypothetical protein